MTDATDTITPSADTPDFGALSDPAVFGYAAEVTTTAKTLGTIYLPKSGTGVGTFDFLVAADAPEVQIDTPVAADTTEGTVIGVVTDMKTVGSMADPFAAEFFSQPRMAAPLAEHADAVKVATVQVFHAPALRSPSAGIVRPATAEELLRATGADRIDLQIPAGVVETSDGEFAKIVLDGHSLLGPESAHCVIGGLSGRAAKTSYAGVLLKSAMHSCAQAGESISAVVFNVKGSDLVNLHLPPAAGYELSADDHAIYEALGIPSTPFDDVVVYAPSLPGGGGTRSAREDAIALRWDLRKVWRYLRYLSPGLYSNDNMAAFLGDVESQKLRTNDPRNRIRTFNQLSAWFDGLLAEAEDGGSSTVWRNHHVATVSRAAKLIGSLPGRCGGLLTLDEARDEDDVPVEDLVDGRVLVVDIAGLEPIVQAAVIASTCERILHKAEQSDADLGVDHVVVFADELNMFAPASGGDMEAIRRVLTKISATGRYAGVSLWGAAQFVSQVSPQVVGNAATRVAGIVSDAEVDSGVYGRLAGGQRERLVTLPKGQVALRAYNLRGLLTVRFPRPAWCTGKTKGQPVRRRPAETDALGLRDQSLGRLTEGIPAEVVSNVIAAHDGNKTDVERELEKLRVPDMAKVSVEKSNTFQADNPWDLD